MTTFLLSVFNHRYLVKNAILSCNLFFCILPASQFRDGFINSSQQLPDLFHFASNDLILISSIVSAFNDCTDKSEEFYV